MTFRKIFVQLVAASALAVTLSGCSSVMDGVSNGEPRPGENPSYRGFDGFVQPLQGPVSLDISLSEGVLFLADNANRGGIPRGRGLRSGFANGGYLGEKPLLNLLDDIEEDMTRQLGKRGVIVAEEADTVLKIKVVDARPSRPTFTQLAREPGLSYGSRARGGLSVEGELIDSMTGESRGTFTYGWYDDLLQSKVGTWSDADRAVDLLSRRLAKQLTPLSDDGGL